MNQERADLVESLRRHRGFLRFTVRNLTDDQARLSPTVSTLTLGGLIKHVTATERQWMGFATGGAEGMFAASSDWAAAWTMTDGDTLDELLAAYQAVADAADALVGDLDLDQAYPLPEAPWFEPGATWSVRRVLLHIIAETSQHAGHADIVRETIDGQKTMG
jgi:uncharacterized damage-inducible protein DinB